MFAAALDEHPIVQPAKGKHTGTVILLHGLGDTGAGWADLAPELQSSGLQYVKFMFPTAPQRPVTLNGGMRMTAWHDLTSLEKIDVNEDNVGLQESARYVESLVKAEESSGVGSRRVVVAGFSQGAAIALLSLRSNVPLAGVLSMSGYLTLADEPQLVSSENKATRLLMCHGDSDPVVQYKYGLESFERLKDAGVNLTMKTYRNLGHSLAQQELADIREFLSDVLPAE